MKDEKKAPKLRFKGFTDDWEQVKYGEIFQRRSKMGVSTPALPSVEYDDINPGMGTLNKEPKSKVTSKRGIHFNPGDVLFGKLRPYLKNWLFACFEGVAVGDFWVLTSSKIDHGFTYSLIQAPEFQYIANLSSGSKMPRSDWGLISNARTFIPTNLSEQKSISSVLFGLDTAITLHEEKKCQLERIKSALLQKMFADKSGYPSVRYKGFDEMWEYCKLEEVFVERNQKEVADANYPLCSFIAHKGVVPKDKYDRSFLVKSDGKKYKRTEINDFIYSSNNLETGSIGLNKFGRATISPVYSIFMVKGDSDFIAGLASTPQFIYEMIRFRQGVVYGQWRIHESDFLKIKYYIPQVTEQEKIGNLLSKLTHAIILHERKLKLLSRVKQSLLQKMFI